MFDSFHALSGSVYHKKYVNTNQLYLDKIHLQASHRVDRVEVYLDNKIYLDVCTHYFDAVWIVSEIGSSILGWSRYIQVKEDKR